MAQKGPACHQDAGFSNQAAEQMDAFLKEQLERLRTDCFDFYLLHGLTGQTWDKMRDLGVREFMDAKQAEGKLLFPAFSFHGSTEDFIRICDEYNWLTRKFSTITWTLLFKLDTRASSMPQTRHRSRCDGAASRGKLARNLPPEMAPVFDASATKRSPRNGRCASSGTSPAYQALCPA